MIGADILGGSIPGVIMVGPGFQVTPTAPPTAWSIYLTGVTPTFFVRLTGFAFGSQSVKHTQSVQNLWVSNQDERLDTKVIIYQFHDVLQADIDLFRELMWTNRGKLYKVTTKDKVKSGYITDNTIVERDNCGGELIFTFLQTHEEDVVTP
ncbi:MAG: hypothetical protein ACW98X_20060 [Promethearchaeota archaeon]|jgi:hypothetical protein